MTRIATAAIAALDAGPFVVLAGAAAAVAARRGVAAIGSPLGTAAVVALVVWLVLASVSTTWLRTTDRRFPLVYYTVDRLFLSW